MNEFEQKTPCEQAIAAHIRAQGAMRFDEFMQFALYDPRHGYYARGDFVFGPQGDFVTAPELSPLFGQAWGQALRPLLAHCKPTLYEFGAGNGKLAVQLLTMLGEHLQNYFIVELSGGLRARQMECIHAHLPSHLACKVKWLDRLPDTFEGLVIGNEVLDAMPVRRMTRAEKGWLEHWVELENPVDIDSGLRFGLREVDPVLKARLQALENQWGPWPAGYVLEWQAQMEGFVKTLTERLQGFAVMIDYGTHAQHLYEPNRTQGTLRAHHRHVAHDDFLARPGQQDLTSHVNFSLVYEALCERGGQLEGYCRQADYLMGHGILALAKQITHFTDPVRGAGARQALHTLLAESEMGHDFKVMMWSRGLELPPWAHSDPFQKNDLSGAL